MKSFAIAALLSTAIFAATQPVLAQQSPDLDAINRRMNSLEGKVDALIDLMQKQQAGQQATSGSANRPPPQVTESGPNVPDGFVSGMYLDIYASGLTVANPNEDTTVEFPAGAPDASTKVAPQTSLPYGQFLKIKETQSLAGVSDSLVGVLYSSYLSVQKTGPHVFQIRTHKELNDNRKRCITQLYLAEKAIVAKDNHESDVSTAQTTVKLTPGLYKISVFLVCGRDHNFKNLSSFSPADYGGIAVDLLMAEPGDHAPQPISSDRLLIKQ